MSKKTVKVSSLAYNDKFTFSGMEYINKGICTVNSNYQVVLANDNICYIPTESNVEIEVKMLPLRDIIGGKNFRLIENVRFILS